MNVNNYIKDNKISVAIVLGFIAVLILVSIGFAMSNNEDNSPVSVSSSTSNEGQSPPPIQ